MSRRQCLAMVEAWPVRTATDLAEWQDLGRGYDVALEVCGRRRRSVLERAESVIDSHRTVSVLRVVRLLSAVAQSPQHLRFSRDIADLEVEASASQSDIPVHPAHPGLIEQAWRSSLRPATSHVPTPRRTSTRTSCPRRRPLRRCMSRIRSGRRRRRRRRRRVCLAVMGSCPRKVCIQCV